MRALVVRTLLVAAGCSLLASRQVSAAAPFVPPPPPPPAPPAPVTPVAPPAVEVAPPAPPAPPAPAAPAVEATAATDHQLVVGRWGIEARSLDRGELKRTPGNDLACNDNCPITINSIGVRRWATSRYAWSAGLALGVGGGSRYSADKDKVQSWDTYLGVGPTLGASFLLTEWKHLAVSFSPQLDALVFMPASSRSKTFLLDLRGVIEGELHLGFIDLPQLSVGLSSGLVASLKTVSQSKTTPTGTASQWSIGFSGPQTFWGLVTNMYLRFYF
jgi:hypothetical protein